MPEFILDSAGTVQNVHAPTMNGPKPADLDFCDLDEFTQGYIEALFFTSCDPSADMADIEPDHEFIDGSIPSDAGFSDLHPKSLSNIIADCAAFQRENAQLLDAAKGLEPGSDGFKYGKESLDDRRLGQLFFYCDQGHGVAFTDDGDSAVLCELDTRAKYYRERSISWGAAADGTESPTGYGFVFVE